ncbi:pentapeptide repeat-containing protein [Nostoc sp. PA-18-2419]|uniref:pentapeptide repeat-containing protein n=1 Tax=Nostoc sp. PA-18-2419 TaxID=2575443 RepID=UPI0011099C68|nr:pentapeptide repeat-containing protein [Nostoc sp. PA-18-2419]
MPQDFSGQNLRGRSFKGQNLTGANFSFADIRGANFTNAILKDADFTDVKAGLQRRWVIGLLIVTLQMSALSGFLSLIIGSLLTGIFEFKDSGKFVIGIVSLVMVTVFFIVTKRKNLIAGAVAFSVIGLVAGAVAGVVVGNYAAFAMIGALIGAISVVVVLAVALVLAVTSAAAFAVAGAFAFVFAFAFAVAGAFVGAYGFAVTSAYAFAITSALAFTLFSGYIGWRSLAGNEKDAWVRSFALAFATTGGTSFRNADLTDANFTQATLKSTDFRKAILTRTCFHKTKKLDRVRPGTTYLQNTKLRQVLVTRLGQNKNFDRLDLRGINFKGAMLVDASFIGVDLSQANLQDADLSRAKLVQAQVNGTDFTGATLTGAYIQDWGITTDTKFDGVQCEYVYMRLPTKENPDPLRKPDNHKEVFAPGEFGDFIQPIFDTLDLYHNQGVDPRAIAISFKQLAENHPDAELEIVAMEKRGQDKFLLRAKTTVTADKSQLSAEYFDSYNQLKGLPEREIKLLLEEKDSRIRSLETMVITALERPSFYSNTQVGQVSTMTNNPGGFSVGGSVGGNVNNVQGDNNRAVQGDNNQAVLGDGNQVTQQNQVGADTGESLTKEDVVKLLAQLETLIQGAELPADTKEEVIEDLSAAKKATDKEEPNKQRALERLGSVADTLDKTSKTVESGQKIWTVAKPIIVKVATWLGVAAGSHLLGL